MTDQKPQIRAYTCTHVGISGTTKIHVREVGGLFVARVGIALMGTTNRPTSELAMADPFEADFNDNYAEGHGTSEQAALDALKTEMEKISEALWW